MIEEVKAIADVIASLGAEGKEAFIWWLISKLLTSVLTSISFLIGIYVVATGIKQIFKMGFESDYDNVYIKDILSTLEIQPSYYGDYTRKDKEKGKLKLRKLMGE